MLTSIQAIQYEYGSRSRISNREPISTLDYRIILFTKLKFQNILAYVRKNNLKFHCGMEKQEKLETLRKEIEAADLPLKKTANLVFGEGNIDCAVMFVGEAPGFNEDMQKRPFVGRAGKVLDECIQEIKWRRSDVYITNIVKRRPPENRDPLPEEIEAYKPYLARQIEIINPKIIATLGRFSMNYFLPLAKISRDHGKVFEAEDPPSSTTADSGVAKRIIFPLYHPAAALRATAVMNDLKADFKKLPDVVSGKSVSKPEMQTPAPKKPEKPQQSKLF